MNKVSIALAARGHNVTAVSGDIDKEPTPNLHYIHLEKMYDTLYAAGGELDINFIEYGNTNPWSQFGPFYEYSYLSCMGIFASQGWQQLKDYPDDFKVYIRKYIGAIQILQVYPIAV